MPGLGFASKNGAFVDSSTFLYLVYATVMPKNI